MSDILDSVIADTLNTVLDERAKTFAPSNGGTRSGTVVKVDLDGTAWVKTAGSSEEFPCIRSQVDVRPNDVVDVRIDGGYATIVGNTTSPGTSTAYVNALAGMLVDAANGNIVSRSQLVSDEATITSLNSYSITAKNLQADVAMFNYLIAHRLSVDSLDATYAQIDLANIKQADIDTASIAHLFAESGAFQDVRVVDGTVVGELKTVRLSGDLINANTIAADKIIVRGYDPETNEPNGLWYRLNMSQAGEIAGYDEDGHAYRFPTAEQVEGDESFQSHLHGSKIIANSITANQVDTESLTADKAFIEYLQTRLLQTREAQIGNSEGSKINIGLDDNDLSRMDFTGQDGTTVAYIVVDKATNQSFMYIYRAQVQKELKIDDWRVFRRTNKNLSVVWTGGAVAGEGTV